MSSLPAHARSVRMRVMLLACAFVLVSGLGVAYWAWPRQFHGILQVGAGQEARYALSNGADTNPRRLAGHIGLSMSKDDILALDPSFRNRQLSSSARYDVAELPFAIGLNGVTTLEAAKVTGRLRVTFRNHVREHEARQGTKVQIGKDEGEILEVRPWSGIVSAPGGPAMVQFSWVNPSGEWKSGLVLSDDTCQTLDARTAVYFAW